MFGKLKSINIFVVFVFCFLYTLLSYV